MSPLVRSGQPQDHSLDALRSRVAELDAALAERDSEVTRVRADLAAFRLRYRSEVGTLHDQLDELEEAIDKSVIAERAAPNEDTQPDPEAAPKPRLPVEPRLTSDAVRKLFRDVAKAIHPDLAQDDLTRDRRHTLMIAANQAYALGDEERLRSILQKWENSPEAVQGTDADAMRLRLVRRIAQVEEQLDACAADLAELRESPLWRLKAMVDEDAGRGKDLIADMVRRLKRDILAARNRLEAMSY